MDHHCPWINNCIGFWNRKYFILLLIYVLLITYTTVLTMAPAFYEAIIWGFNNKFMAASSKDTLMTNYIMIMISFILDVIVASLMTAFLKFHIMLGSENKTTIENLDKLGKPF